MMAHVSLAQEDIKALEQTRQRLFQLTSNIASLKQDILQSNPLPQWFVAMSSGPLWRLAQKYRRFRTNRELRTGLPSKPPPRF